MEPYDLNNILQTYNSVSQHNNNQEICCICQDIVDNGEQVYELPECKHMFHTNCIMTWFRAKNNACPLCANPGINNKDDNLTRKDYGYYGGWTSAQRRMTTTRFKMVAKIIKEKDCPNDLCKLYKTLLKDVDAIHQLKKNLDSFKKQEKNEMPYAKALKETEKYLRKLRTLGLKIYKQVNDVIEYPIVPIIIPTRQ
tara:strand:- start:857 stop:1444 length:588 start_codon:yes stop_codon:yes gene_type:complete